jgi:pimeloyl-ACP methyl ester carboxylesterase
MNANSKNAKPDCVSGYAPVNGLRMYYEVHGDGFPLVLIHGGGSNIDTTFGRVLKLFAQTRKVIAVDLQSHGRTAHIERRQTFKNDADDVAALLQHLKCTKADVLGFSNGANTTLQIALRHPKLVRKMVICSAFYKRDGMNSWFWDFISNASLYNMPQQLKDEYLKVAPNPIDLSKMFDNDQNRMLAFVDWGEDLFKSIKAPTLVIAGDNDVMKPEHTVKIWRLIPKARLAILPGVHGAYIGEVTTGMENSQLPVCTTAIINEFLDAP